MIPSSHPREDASVVVFDIDLGLFEYGSHIGNLDVDLFNLGLNRFGAKLVKMPGCCGFNLTGSTTSGLTSALGMAAFT